MHIHEGHEDADYPKCFDTNTALFSSLPNWSGGERNLYERRNF